MPQYPYFHGGGKKNTDALGQSHKEFVVLLPKSPLREKAMDPSGCDANMSRCVMVENSSIPDLAFCSMGVIWYF